MDRPKDIFEFIKTQETAYAQSIEVIDGYSWGMKEHVRLTALYKNSIFSSGKDDNKPFKNIIRPILNLAYRAEDIDLKDIALYVDDPEEYYLSFLVKKYHDDVFVVEHDLDTFLDEIKESKIDYGGGLAKRGKGGMPETVPLQSIAFCDQSDLLSGPQGFKHFFAPDQLLDMASAGWGNTANGATTTLEELIVLARDAKVPDAQNGKEVKTPGKYIEVYEVHGSLPSRFLNGDEEDNTYTRQLQIVAFYKATGGSQEGVTLFRGRERTPVLKLLSRDKIYGRALGLGGAEEIFEPQVWTNYDEIRKKELLDAAAKMILKTTDSSIAAKHPSGLKDVDNLEIIQLAEGTDLVQIDTFPKNIALFDKSIADWEAHAQQMGAANDAILGQSPTAGTPFKLQELVTQESHGLHDYRRGKNAKFIEEVYRDWIIPQIAKEITGGSEFLSELSLEELQTVADSLVTCQTNDFIKAQLLKGKVPLPDELETYKQKVRDQFMKGGNKRFIKILQGELKDAPLKVKVNVSGKQKDLAATVDKLVNIFRQIIAAPQILDDPRMAKIFNEILEYSGLSPVDFYQKPPQQIAPPTPVAPGGAVKPAPAPSPLPPNLQALAK